jgi:hypothetical protein
MQETCTACHAQILLQSLQIHVYYATEQLLVLLLVMSGQLVHVELSNTVITDDSSYLNTHAFTENCEESSQEISSSPARKIHVNSRICKQLLLYSSNALP